jgi:hypothetical protein
MKVIMEISAIVNEPHTQYQVKSWQTDLIPDFNLGIIRIEDDKILVKQNSIKIQIPEDTGKKTPISSLRGKMGKIDEEQIDKKLSKLRNEWKRDF